MPEQGASAPRPAASVILVRERTGTKQIEVYLIRRNHKASFMSSAFVFPGGSADPGEENDPRLTAARELFEEAGILLARKAVDAELVRRWRAEVASGNQRLADLLGAHGTAVDLGALRYYAHWITPSAEPRRFSAVFYLAVLPAGQTPSVDQREAVDEVWVTPAEALARAGELMLPPPQLRTFFELSTIASYGMEPLLAATDARAMSPYPILPRLMPSPAQLTLLLPWDPDYVNAGTGDALSMPPAHPLAQGPSRFVFEDKTWKHIDAPSSPRAG